MIVETFVAIKCRVQTQQNLKRKVEVKALFFAATRKKWLCNSTCSSFLAEWWNFSSANFCPDFLAFCEGGEVARVLRLNLQLWASHKIRSDFYYSVRGVVQKRIFYGPDRKGGGVGISPLGPDRKQMWKFWSNFPFFLNSKISKLILKKSRHPDHKGGWGG